jgi:hypothetical protein
MNQDKGKATRLMNRTPNPVMYHFELAMLDRHIQEQPLFLFRGEMGELVWFHYE